jgi:uncharacterized protein YndB with AHSA1/START domain
MQITCNSQKTNSQTNKPKSMEKFTKITVTNSINAPIEKVWVCFNIPEHVVNWNFASDDWFCPKSTNDLRVGGSFNHTMAARDGSFSFDFEGVYNDIKTNESLAYGLADGRQILVTFEKSGESVVVTEVFDAETENPVEMQQAGWQAILDNFKGYVESITATESQ